MTVLSDVIAVTVNVNTLNPQFPGFGIPLIVGKFSPSIAQVMSITVNNAVQGDTYVAIVNGNTYTYTGDSTTTVTHYALGLGALITAGEPSLTLSYLVGVITVTANTPGNPFTCISGTETGSITVASVTTNYAGPLGVNRYAQFTSMAAVAAVFPQTSVAGVDAVEMSKIWKMANALFSQPRAPQYIYIGKFDTVVPDASFSAALTAINAVLNDFYAVMITSHAAADIKSLASWTETAGKVSFTCSEDSAVLSTGGTDEAIVLQQFGYNRSPYMWHWQGGVDASMGSGTASVSGTQPNYIITITNANHGLRVGDPVTFYNFTTVGGFNILNGDWTVATVPTTGTFTINVTNNTTLAAGAIAQAFVYYARYTYPECAWVGLMLPTTPGTYNWANQNLVGQIPTPISFLGVSVLTEAQELIALSKNANLYTPLGGVGIVRKGTAPSGRFIDITIGLDWLASNIQQAIFLMMLQVPKIPYTDAGMVMIRNAITGVMNQAIANNLLGPLIPPTSNSGELFRIIIPAISSQALTDRLNRVVRGIQIIGQLAGAVNMVNITINAQF